MFISFDNCTNYTTHAVKPLNIEFGVSNTDILAKIWDSSHFRLKFAQISHCYVTVRCQILIILLDHCTINMIWPVKPLNIEFCVSNTTILDKIWDFSHFWPKFAQIIYCDVILRCPILFILFDHCTNYTTHAVKSLNIEFGVSNTDILAKIWDFSHFGPKFAQIRRCDVTVICPI